MSSDAAFSARMTFHVLFRKLRTVALTIRRVSNWPEVAWARMGRGPGGGRVPVRLRTGIVVEPLRTLRTTWGEIFEAAVADLYGLRVLASRSNPPDLVVDVGANVGAFTCCAAGLLPSARIVAFEPAEEHASQLERNVAANSLTNVTLHRHAVTRDGREIIFQVNGDGGSSGIILPGERTLRLPSVRLDATGFAGSRRCLLKLDCEGAEGEILPWVCENRAALPPALRIACEFHHWSPLSLTDSVALLETHGFTVSTPVLFDEQYLFADSGW